MLFLNRTKQENTRRPTVNAAKKNIRFSFFFTFVFASVLYASSRKQNERYVLKEHQSKELNLVEDYFEAMNGDLEKYADTLYSYTPRFQMALGRWQNPKACDKAKFLVFQMWGFGLGSVYLAISAALSIAIETNRILIFEYGKSGSFVHARGCSSETNECFFKPISHCSLEFVQNLVDSGKFSSRSMGNEELRKEEETNVIFTSGGKRKQFDLALLRERIGSKFPSIMQNLELEDIEQLKEITLKDDVDRKKYILLQVWTSQSLLYLMRLNAKTQEIVRRSLKGCFGESSRRQMLTETLSLPIRGSDKCHDAKETVGEMSCVSPEQVFDIARRIQHMQPSISSVMITSEDESLLNRTTTIFSAEKWSVLKNTFDLHQGSGRSGQFNLDGDKPPNYVVTYSMLSSLTCQLFAGYRIVTTKSNYHMMISALSRVVPGKTWDFSYEAGDIPSDG